MNDFMQWAMTVIENNSKTLAIAALISGVAWINCVAQPQLIPALMAGGTISEFSFIYSLD
ncbi:MAG: hypothetical protein JWQ69_5232 [Pseudomonas sp.]|nr:hypothetical protein [Pseudomonas sp.]